MQLEESWLNVSEIRLRRPVRSSVRGLSGVVGLDTETLCSGYAFLVADSEGNYAWIRKLEDLFPFILSGKRYVCWNMGFDAEAMLKWFGKEFCEKLIKSGTQQKYNDITVWYVPNKFLSFIRREKGHKGDTWTTFWDVAQFYKVQGHFVSLRSTAKHVGMAKIDYKIPGDGFDESYYDSQQLLEYCVQDAKIAGALGNLLIKEYNSMGIKVPSLASPSTVAQSYVLDQTRTWIPDINFVPLEALQYAEDVAQSPWRVFFKRGSWERMYNYDINSAYPHAMYRLIDMSDGVWKKVRGKVPEWAERGYVKCMVEVPEVYVSWVNFRNELGSNFNPHGKFPVTLTLNGLNNLPPGTKVDIIDGWYFISWEIRYVYREVMRDLLSVKGKTKPGSLSRQLIKVLAASLHGKFRQVHPDRFAGELVMGRMFFPPYAAEVNTDVKLSVYNIAKQIPPQYLIGVHTDCVYCADKLDMELSTRPGKWDLRSISPLLVIGLQHFESKGDWFRKRIKESPDAVKYSTFPDNVGPLSMKEAVKQGEFEKVGVFGPIQKDVDITSQCFNRFWPNPPTCGKDLLNGVYDSEMLPVEVVECLIG